MACSSVTSEVQCRALQTESYIDQRKRFWPKTGRHILAQFDDNTIVVYQAFKPCIAEHAVEKQIFGGPDFSFDRMSWIKTNFLWMMYRSGWASKKNQERVLAVKITRDGFEEILAKAYTSGLQKSKGLTNDDIEVRLQWDPDHDPTGEKEQRRAIQLGLKGQTLRKYGTEWIVSIEDITEFVRQQHRILKEKGQWDIMTARERVYPVKNPYAAQRIALDFYDESGPTLVT